MKNSELVQTALTELFIKNDLTALDRYWSENYIQHNPMIGNGRESLKNIFEPLLPNLTYEMNLISENGDFVIVHGRITGFGPKPVIVVDTFRIQDGKLAEHWDVIQEEVPAEQTVSKNAMYPLI